MAVEKGFNSDINWRGQSFHVQTEDWGRANPFLVSRIFRNGAVVGTVKTPYGSVLPEGAGSAPAAVRFAMKVQHESILDLLVSGQLLDPSLE